MDNRLNGYIFFCSNETEDECLELSLFGGSSNSLQKLSSLKQGDYLFLYNFTSKRLHGVFTAQSDLKMDINPHAWDGKFPCQVKVSRVQKYEPIPKEVFQSFVTFTRNGFMEQQLSSEQVDDLIFIFNKEYSLPEEEKDFRLKYPAENFTSDGHRVRSMGEVTIDNWLFTHRVHHGYECWVPTREPMLCDFYIPIRGKIENIYIEYWGREDEKYLKRRAEKIAIYKKYNLTLIELTRKDLEDLDKVLNQKLLPYLSEE
jgi:hypothetical protein